MDDELYDGSPDPVLRADTQSEAELCVKRMLGHQLDTDITLGQVTASHKSFTPAVTFRPFVEQASGQLSLEQFEVLQKEHQGLDELRACGLTDQEIALKLENEGRHVSSLVPPYKRGNFVADPVARNKRLKAVNEKIQQKKASLGMRLSDDQSSHHQADLQSTGCEVVGGSSCAFPRPSDIVRHPTTLGLKYIHPDDPINHLDVIAAGLFGKSKDKQDEKASLRNENAMTHVWAPMGECSTGCRGDISHTGERFLRLNEDSKEKLPDGHHGGLSMGCSSTSNGDVSSKGSVMKFFRTDSHSSQIRNLPNTSHKGSFPEGQCKTKTDISNQATGDVGSEQKSQPVDPGASETCGSVRSVDNEPRRLASLVIPLSREDLLEHRLSENDICKMERFRKYSAGQPSKVLFLKNLSAKVTEEDLASVFISFQHQDKPKIIFKLLKGRMKGQAFVTFADEETATEAMSHVNGYHLRGKPVIIQYGKHR